MRALITLNIVIPVEDEEDAGMKGVEYEKAARLGMVAALEQSQEYVDSGLSIEDIERWGGFLGVSVMVMPDYEDVPA